MKRNVQDEDNSKVSGTAERPIPNVHVSNDYKHRNKDSIHLCLSLCVPCVDVNTPVEPWNCKFVE
jgi:hypothetical protein